MKENRGVIIKMREKKKVIAKQIPTQNSITCGSENPATMGCVFYVLEDGEVATFFTPQMIHEGQLRIMHGGLTAAVLDELMGRAVLSYYEGEPPKEEGFISRYVTAEMTTKYKKPIIIGSKTYGYGRVIRNEGRRTYAFAELLNEEGEIVATAESVFVEIKVSKEELTDRITSNKICQKLSEKDPKEL